MLVRCLLATLLAIAMPSAPRAQAEAPSGHTVTPIQGLALEPGRDGAPPKAFRFELVPDSGIVVEDLGPIELSTRPDPINGLPPIPEGEPEASILIPQELFLMMAKKVDEAVTPPPNRSQLGFSIVDGRFRLSFDQGVPLLTLGLAAALIAGLAGAGVAGIFLMRERRRKAEHLRVQRRQAEAREAERARLAREIHDGPLQDLHALRATLATPGGDGAPVLGSSSGAPSLDDGIGGVAHELRAIAEGLRPPALGRFGLAAALGAHATRFRERHPHVEIRLALEDDGGPGGSRLSEPARATLFRIAQEAMSNAVQHGDAQVVEIRLAFHPSPETPEELILEVRDDGVGLGPLPDLDTLVGDGHFGLVGMHERASLLDGSLTLVSAGLSPRPGTIARLTAPWDSVSAETPA